MPTRVAALVAAALLAAGCGGGSDREQDPATVVPSSAYMYLEADLDPSGNQQEAVRTVLATLPGVGEPERRLQEHFDAYAQRRYGLHAANFERDIKPWLGDRVGTFVLVPAHGTTVDHPPAGIVTATRDVKKARHWLFEVSRRPAERERTYKSVRYLWMGGRERMAYGIVEGFAVAADEAAFKAVVDSARGSRSLATRQRFERATAKASDDRLGFLWYDPHRVFDTVARRLGRGYFKRAIPAVRRLVPDDPLLLTIAAKPKTVVLSGEVPAGKGGVLTSLFDEGGALMDQLPKDAVAVVGQPNFGDYLRKLLALSNAGEGGYAGMRRDLRREGLDLERDLLGWMTDAAVFLHEDHDHTLTGALVVQSGDANAVYDGVLRLGRFIYRTGGDVRDVRLPGSDLGFTLRVPGLRKPLYVAEAGKRMVVAYGRESAQSALSNGGLGGAAHYERARGKLGLDWGPAAYVDIQRLLPLIDLGDAEQYLKAARYLIVGGRVDGKRLRSHTELVFR
jgi:hypothetical protein